MRVDNGSHSLAGKDLILTIKKLFVMKIQEEYGPDSILPNFCLRGKFNYFVSIKPQGKKNFECELQTGELFSDDLTTIDSKDTSIFFTYRSKI